MAGVPVLRETVVKYKSHVGLRTLFPAFSSSVPLAGDVTPLAADVSTTGCNRSFIHVK